MADKKEKIAIVIRSFWPNNPAIGEGLLLLTESLSKHANPIVITQVKKGFSKQLQASDRGAGVKFSTLPSLTNSSSHMFLRICELIVYTLFVFISLCLNQPDRVYVATNPPIFTPLIVRWYCTLFNKKYIYHLQDIHPEATQVVTGKRNWLTQFISKVDSKTIVKATAIITLTEQMKAYILKRTKNQLHIVLLNNPSVKGVSSIKVSLAEREKGFVYCGNAGRLQRIPLMLESIKKYLNEGGGLSFVFAGGGIYKKDIEKLASEFEQVSYLGLLTAEEAAGLLQNYTFGLMPIDDEVTNYAFPSKSSSYVFSGCHVIAVCGKETSVADWVIKNKIGFVAEPNVEDVVSLFHRLEQEPIAELQVSEELIKDLTPKEHAKKLEEIIFYD